MNGLARFLGHPRVIGLCRIAIGLVFLAAALAKIGDVSTFARQIHHFRLVPFGFENLLAITLPWIELVLALAILTGVQSRAGSMVATGLMGLFVVVVAAAVARGLDIECGCFGTADASRVGVSKLIENVGLLALAVIGGQSSR